MNAREMLREPRQGYVLLNIEPEFDCYDAGQALAALSSAASVIVLTPFKGRAMEYADCLLPISPFTETSGTFVNLEGRAQSFNAVVKPLDQARPGWKVLRVLGSMLGLVGFEFDSSEAVREAVLHGEKPIVSSRLGNQAVGVAAAAAAVAAPAAGLQRVGEVPIYFADALVRRAASLQRTRDAQPPRAGLNPDTARQLGVGEGDPVRVRQGGGEAVLPVAIDATLAVGCVRVAAGHPATAALGELHGPITVERG